MKVVVTLERRFERTPDGAVWTRGDGSHRFWNRYLSVFSEVTVVARASDVKMAPEGAIRVDGPRVSVAALPHYVGPPGYLRHWRTLRRALQEAASPTHAVILRVPSPIAATLAPLLRSQGRPYGVEVLGDPYEVFAPGAVRHPLSWFFRWWLPWNMRADCASACAASYVTREALQGSYPCRERAIAVSDVDLSDDDFVPAGREVARVKEPRRAVLVSVGSLEQLYKGTDVLLDAVGLCIRRGVDLELVLVGDGRARPALERRAAALGLGGRVRFMGQLPNGSVRAQLDQADVFVLPSRTEGLPRAMVEAMARAVPCIGTRVGGIPELLEDEDLVTSGDPVQLAAKVEEVLGSAHRRAAMSSRNLARAAEYRDELLRPRRNEFYRRVRESAQAWLLGAAQGSDTSTLPSPSWSYSRRVIVPSGSTTSQ